MDSTVVNEDQMVTEQKTFTWSVTNFADITETATVFPPHWGFTLDSTPPMQSCSFTTGATAERRTEWTIVLYPCMTIYNASHIFNVPKPEFVSIQLYTRRVSQAVRQIQGSMSFLNAQGEKVFRSRTRSYYEGCGWQRKALLHQGFEDFDIVLSRQNFFRDELRLLHGGTLTIQCDIGVQYQTVPNQSDGLHPTIKFTTGPTNRQGRQVPHDVTLRCRGVTYLAHKGVLAAGSPEFARIFRDDWLLENQRRVVYLPHMEVDRMEQTLQNLYDNYVRSLQPHMYERLFYTAGF